MEVRRLKMGDVQTVLKLSERQLAKTVYNGIKFSKRAASYQLRRAMSDATEACFVLEHEGKIRGYILLAAIPYWCCDPNTGQRYVADLAFTSTVRGGGEMLLERAIEWAKGIPRVMEFTSLHSSGIHGETIEQVYKAVGMEQLGAAFWIDFREERKAA